jgi:hypothetical protein
MLTLSDDRKVADQQMLGLIVCLTCFGYIDGEFDPEERSFIEDYIDRIVRERAESIFVSSERPWEREARIRDEASHFQRIFDQIERGIAETGSEFVAEGERQEDYQLARLELQAYQTFQRFDRESQRGIFETIDELLMADGHAHPNELKFRKELQSILGADVEIQEEGDFASAPAVVLRDLVVMDAGGRNHPLFEALESHYPTGQPGAMAEALLADYALMTEVMALHDAQRKLGRGKLAGADSFRDFEGGQRFLDDYVWVVPPADDEPWDITVLGDLHGCYSCLKAAVIQSRFFERLAAWRRDPSSVARPALVLLGDYLDRGLFSFHGVLRGALELFKFAPEHVFVLRGNHEYFFHKQGQVLPAVHPADALVTLQAHAPYELQLAYKNFFDALPTALVFDQLLFVHGGIPKEQTLRERFTDLSSLNDAQVRLDMMWGDPEDLNAVPDELQLKATRFPFGRLQCQAFLSRIGCHTMIRGHEKVLDGFAVNYQDGEQVVLTLFSAGGSANSDLPPKSNYRKVAPKALTVRYLNGAMEIEPWAIDYAPYVTGKLNAFYR